MITIVAAMDVNGVIGVKGKLPWHLPQELAHFKAMTTGHTVVMGRKTFESIGKPLPQRRNIVLTTQSVTLPDVETLHSVEEVFRLSEHEDVMIIGGSEVYELFLPHADVMVLSVIDGVYEGDARFPMITEEWVKLHTLPKEGFSVDFYTRRRIDS